ncbi:MAG TPA: hypothetical protein VKK79_10020 [Candidatus Lokiarchaeia archaeon]|nr:hypothetical protein [Candidatus Lokiarchaeia archaeon]
MFSEELIILNTAGQILFYYSPVSGTDCQTSDMLMGNFLVAIQQFAQAMTHGSVSGFEMQKKRILIRDSDKLPVFYVLIIDQKSKIANKEKKLEDLITKVKQAFEKQYNEDAITSWDGDAAAFCEFKNRFDKL